jgi:nitroreductase
LQLFFYLGLLQLTDYKHIKQQMMDLLKYLEWRYACKFMNGKKVEANKLDTILEAIRLAPTSMGLQLFKVLVISDQDTINKIYEEAAPRQKMLEGCSHLLVFAAYSKLTEEDINSFIDRMGKLRNITGSQLEKYRSNWMALLGLPHEEFIHWAAKQTYITMAYASVAAAELKIDSTPVEGFESEKVDEILHLDGQNLKSTLLFPLGYRDEAKDALAGAPKIRKDSDDLFIRIGE